MGYTIDEVKKQVRKKGELSGISESVLDKALSDYLKNENIDISGLNEKDLKIIVKDIREVLRQLHGRFQISFKNRDKLLHAGDIDSILKGHLSTKERLDIYPKIKEMIYSMHPSSIIDLACGLNPLALARKDIRYFAVDINEEEISLIKKFFEKTGIEGDAICADVLDLDFDSLGKFDVCLIFKFLDFVKDGNKLAQRLINSVNSKNFIVSFATQSISGRSSRQTRRIWFERILRRSSIDFNTFEFDNEIFYLFKKN